MNALGDDPDDSIRRCCSNCEDADLASRSAYEQLTNRRFIVCGVCGNKRCPKATDHALDCTGSNEPGQKGSRYAVRY